MLFPLLLLLPQFYLIPQMLEGKAIKSQVRVLGLQQFYSITCQKISSGHALDSHFVIEILSLESIEFAKKKIYVYWFLAEFI